MPDTVLWLRRDLRLDDHPALLAAAEQADGGRVLPLFVLDPALWAPPGRRAAHAPGCCARCASLRAATDGALVVRRGDPEQVLPDVVRELRAPAPCTSPPTPAPTGAAATTRRGGPRAPRLVRTGTPTRWARAR